MAQWRQLSGYAGTVHPVRYLIIDQPADVIAFILEDMGIPASLIDIGAGSSFAAAATTFTAWGLEFNGAFWYKQDRAKVLAALLNMCHSTLVVTDKIGLKVLYKASQKTITKADILKREEKGPGDLPVQKHPERPGIRQRICGLATDRRGPGPVHEVPGGGRARDL